MKLPGLKTLRQSTWRIRGRLLGGGVILGYHRVAEDPGDPWKLCVSPADFESQMEILRRDFEPVRLSAVGSARRGGPLEVAVTFDDGYADVFTGAVPILERHSIPATVFVVPAAIDGSFWWDRLRAILAAPASLPERLEPSDTIRSPGWSRDEGLPVLHTRLHRALRTLDHDPREAALRELGEWAGSRPDEATVPPVLSTAQLDALGSHALIEVGSHTATHADLSALTPEDLDHEIGGSRLELARLVGRDVESFSYPHGGLGPSVRERVMRAGYRRACSSSTGLVSRGTDPFLLPRIWPPPAGGETFRRWIRSWTGH